MISVVDGTIFKLELFYKMTKTIYRTYFPILENESKTKIINIPKKDLRTSGIVHFTIQGESMNNYETESSVTYSFTKVKE